MLGIAGKTLGLKAVMIGAPVLMAVSAVGGGWAMNEFWLGKNARADIDRKDATITQLTRNLATSNGLLDAAGRDNAALLEREKKREERLDDLADVNLKLQMNRATNTVRIIEKGETIGDELAQIDGNAWLRNKWPERLLDYANGDDSINPTPVNTPLDFRN